MSYTHGAGDTLFSAIEHVINKALRAPDVP